MLNKKGVKMLKKWTLVFKNKDGETVSGDFNGKMFGVIAAAFDYLGVKYDVYYGGKKIEKENTT